MGRIIKLFMTNIHHRLTLHIHSFPNFSLEILTGILLCILYYKLHMELSKMWKNTVKPVVVGNHKTNSDVSVDPEYCEKVGGASIIQVREWKKKKKHHNGIKTHHLDDCNCTVERIDSFLALSTSDYLRLHKEKRKLETQARKPSLLSKLLKSATLTKTKEEIAKEYLKLAKMSGDSCNRKRLKNQHMTPSLVDMLEKLISSPHDDVTSKGSRLPANIITSSTNDISDVSIGSKRYMAIQS